MATTPGDDGVSRSGRIDPGTGLARLAEDGLRTLDGALTSMGLGFDRLTGAGAATRGDPDQETVHIDDLTSAWANHALRTALHSWWQPALWPAAGGEMMVAAVDTTRRFLDQGLRARTPGTLAALPLRLPLSWAGLMTQEGLRAVTTAQVVSPNELADFAAFVAEIFSDLDVYFPLRYRRELTRWQARVAADPKDLRARIELGRTYLKCGLFDQAANELLLAAEPSGAEPSGAEPGDRALRAKALYHALVAARRAGDLGRAFQAGIRCLELDPEHESARYWLFLTAQQAGGYPDAVPAELRMEARDGYQPTRVRYEEVSATIGLDKVSGGRGTAVADFFGDGRLHVAIAGAHAGVGLFRNRGDGSFDDVSVSSGLESCVYGFALSAADFDNDGLADLFVTSLGFYNGRSQLFHNEGGGKFRNVTREAGLGEWGPAFTATWADTTGDGLLDLFVAYNLGGLFDRKTPNRLFRNQGDGTFVDVTREAGLLTPWPTIGACFGDFTGDGTQDLFVSGLGRAQLFRNRGDGTFVDVSREAGIDAPAIGSAALAIDLDGDGRLDIVQTTYSRPRHAIYTLRHGHGPADGSPTRLWRNLGCEAGVPKFADVAESWRLTGCWGTMSATAGDFENSGHQGLFLGNGDPSMDRAEASVLLLSDGTALRNATFSAGLPFMGKGHGVNCADLSGDGRMHLMVASGGLYPGDLAATEVYRSVSRPGSYLGVWLVGTASNRDAIGAHLRLEVGGREQHRHVSGGSGFGWMPLQQHFGLGDADGDVAALEIRWPSGLRERVEGLRANTTVEITEGRATQWRRVPTGDQP